MEVVLYSTGCDRCKVLEQILLRNKVPFTIIEGEEEIEKIGLKFAPVLKVDNSYLEFGAAVTWANKYRG